MLVFVQVFFAIFGVMDPVGNVPLFITLTHSLDKEKRNRLAKTAVLYAFGILTAFMFAGSALLDVFQVSMGSFRIAGGIVLFTLGFQILFGIDFEKKKEEISGEKDISVVPLATPLIAGPGTITSVIILGKEYGYSLTLFGIITNLVLSYILFRFSHLVVRVLGTKGVLLFANIMGLILMAIGIEFIKKSL